MTQRNVLPLQGVGGWARLRRKAKKIKKGKNLKETKGYLSCATRKPLLLFLFLGSLLFLPAEAWQAGRFATRQLLLLLFQDPPRTTWDDSVWPVPPDPLKGEYISLDQAVICPCSTKCTPAIVIAVSDTSSGSPFARDTVSVSPLPSAMITQQGDSLMAPAAQGYQWLFNETPISAEQVYYPQETGNYSVMVTDSNGCTAASEDFYVEILAVSLPENVQLFRLAPNPTKSMVQLSLELHRSEQITLLLTDAQQRLLQTINLSGSSVSHTLDMQELPAGVYFLTVRLESGVLVRKVVKVR